MTLVPGSPVSPARTSAAAAPVPSADDVVAWIKRTGSKKVKDGMVRYNLPTARAFGIQVGVMQKKAKEIGKNHELALALWRTGWYEARMLAAFLDEPEKVTAAQMDAWCKDFDNWGITDTVCFALFDRTPHAWGKIPKWARSREEFVKRGAFALLASLVAHDKAAPDSKFIAALPLIEKAAQDERNLVIKGVNWSLRCIGKRNKTLNKAALALSERLAESEHPSARWVGKDAVRELRNPKLLQRLK